MNENCARASDRIVNDKRLIIHDFVLFVEINCIQPDLVSSESRSRPQIIPVKMNRCCAATIAPIAREIEFYKHHSSETMNAQLLCIFRFDFSRSRYHQPQIRCFANSQRKMPINSNGNFIFSYRETILATTSRQIITIYYLTFDQTADDVCMRIVYCHFAQYCAHPLVAQCSRCVVVRRQKTLTNHLVIHGVFNEFLCLFMFRSVFCIFNVRFNVALQRNQFPHHAITRLTNCHRCDIMNLHDTSNNKSSW